MDKETIMQFAREAGMVQDGDVWFSPNSPDECDVRTIELEAFAKLVAAEASEHEREACARLVDYWEAREGEHADAIRARVQA